MAELAVLNIAKSLLQQLSSPAKAEFLLLFNSDTELKKLENTIRTIKDVLHDAEQRKATNTDIGGWLSRLKDEMYKADDLFDTLSTRALRKKVILGNKFRKEMKIFFSESNQVAFIFKTAHEVKELRERLDDIAKDIGQFGLLRDTKVYDQRPVLRRSAEHSYIAEDEVIGREKEKEELLRLLLADAGAEERVSVIAVVGIGGQGKTAIAQLLYNAKKRRLSFLGITDLAFLPEELENSSLVARSLSVCCCPNFKRSSLFYLVQKLPSLESLTFLDFEATESLIEVENMAKDGMPWRWLKRLKELHFEFGSDPLGTHLLNGLHHLTRLERLTISGRVPKDEDMQWTAPPNLKHLSIESMEEVAGLTRVIRQSKNLQTLTVYFCKKIDEHELNKLPWEDLSGLRKLWFTEVSSMRSLPDKCRHLLALEDLIIRFCPEITSLPDWVSRLTLLEIEDCTKLKEKCRKPAGSCWPLIRDIPYLSIS